MGRGRGRVGPKLKLGPQNYFPGASAATRAASKLPPVGSGWIPVASEFSEFLQLSDCLHKEERVAVLEQIVKLQ